MSDTPPHPAAHPDAALPRGTRLGEFELRHVLGVGGFAIVYLAFDHQLEREVAVKEYMPTLLAGRTETLHVSLRSKGDAETFAIGLKSFVNEARLLARFDLPALVRVHRFWEANGTAYMAMPVVRGQSAKAWRQAQTSPPDEAWLRALLEPMLDTLEKLHGHVARRAAGPHRTARACLHRARRARAVGTHTSRQCPAR
jgi:serine/threonine protein kinase